MTAARAANRVATEKAWAEAIKSRIKHRFTQTKARAAIESAKADIIVWLADEVVDPNTHVPDITKQLIGKIGDVISTDVFDSLCEALAHRNLSKLRAGLAEKHLFCSLLAAIACAMKRFGDDLNASIGYIVQSILDSSISDKQTKIPRFVAEVVAKVAVRGIDRVAQNFPIMQHYRSFQQAIEILAIMICPAPEKHEAVFKCCVQPLGEPILGNEVQKRIQMAVPPSWIE